MNHSGVIENSMKMNKEIKRYTFKDNDGCMYVTKRISLSKALRSMKNQDVDIKKFIECVVNGKRVPSIYFSRIRDHVVHGR